MKTRAIRGIGASATAGRPVGAATALILAPRWRLGRRSSARRSVEAAIELWRPRVGRLTVAAQAAAAPAMRDAAGDGLLIVPDSDSPLSAVGCALHACPGEPLLILRPDTDASDRALGKLMAALQGDGAAVAALVHPESKLLPFPLLCRQAVRPLVDALLHGGHDDISDLMRLPCARAVLL